MNTPSLHDDLILRLAKALQEVLIIDRDQDSESRNIPEQTSQRYNELVSEALTVVYATEAINRYGTTMEKLADDNKANNVELPGETFSEGSIPVRLFKALDYAVNTEYDRDEESRNLENDTLEEIASLIRSEHATISELIDKLEMIVHLERSRQEESRNFEEDTLAAWETLIREAKALTHEPEKPDAALTANASAEEIVEEKFLISSGVQMYFGAPESLEYEFDTAVDDDTDEERMRIQRPVLLLDIKNVSDGLYEVINRDFEKFHKDMEEVSLCWGLSLNDITTREDVEEGNVVSFSFFDDESTEEYGDGGDPSEDEYFVISWETEADYNAGREKEITVHGEPAAIKLATSLVSGHFDNRKYYASQVNDRHGEIVWASMEEIYEHGGVAEGSTIALDAPAIPTKPGNTVTYRWVVDVAVPALKSILRIERWATGAEEWVPVQGQWYLGTLLGAPGFYAQDVAKSDVIAADFGSGSAFSGLQVALKEAQELIGPEKFHHGGTAPSPPAS